jgi:hypothetical protein
MPVGQKTFDQKTGRQLKSGNEIKFLILWGQETDLVPEFKLPKLVKFSTQIIWQSFISGQAFKIHYLNLLISLT